MPGSTTAAAVLDRAYLDIRAKLLELAALLDRIERGRDAGRLQGDPRLQQIAAGIAALEQAGGDRAERVQMIFSDPYVPHWSDDLPRRG